MTRQSSETPLTRRSVLKGIVVLSSGAASGFVSGTGSAEVDLTKNLQEGNGTNISDEELPDGSPIFQLQFTESWSLAPPPSFPQQHIEQWSLAPPPSFPQQHIEQWPLAQPPSFPLQHTEQWSLAQPPSFPLQHTEQWTEGPPIETVDGTVPRDTDDDGLYEDFNGDGELNFPDVNVFFQHSDQPEITDYTSYYDFTGNGTINLQDVMKLFRSV